MKYFFALSFATPRVILTTNIRVPLLVESQGGLIGMTAINTGTSRTEFLALNPLIRPSTGSQSHQVVSADGSVISIHPTHRYLGREETSYYGFDNQLVPQFESVAVLQSHNDNPLELVLNASEDAFAASCVPGSLLRTMVQGNYFGRGFTSVNDSDVLLLGQFRVFFSTRFVAEVPRNYVDLIRGRMIAEGALLESPEGERAFPLLPPVDSRVIRFRNCHDRPSIQASLPSIRLMMSLGGSLQLEPEDYVRFHPEGICDLMLVALRDKTNPIFTINPLAVPGINLRRTSTFIEFCDTVV